MTSMTSRTATQQSNRSAASCGVFVVALVLVAACAGSRVQDEGARSNERIGTAVTTDTTLVCNGAAALCDRRFNEVAYPATHNAMSALTDGFANSDQRYGIARQLSDGIRSIELDVWPFQSAPTDAAELYLCHRGACDLGKRKLADGLADVAAFLDSHPHDVLTLLFEDHAPAMDIFAALDAAGLRERMHTQPRRAPWPTLRQLIQADTRLVATFERQYAETQTFPAGYQFAWDYAFDTTWEFTQPADFNQPDGSDCAVFRGDAENGLFILNHMLVTDTRAEEFAHVINLESSLLTRARTCRTLCNHIPNFIKVDYYDVGDLFSSVRKLNGLE